MSQASIFEALDDMRRRRGLLELAEVMALAERGNVILDPFSTLISRAVEIGRDNRFEPNVQLLCAASTSLRVGDANTFCAATRLDASTGPISVGRGNAFGPGGFMASTTSTGAMIEIGDGGRYTLNCAVSGRCILGSGSQILGPIALDGCCLGAGGTHLEPDPDRRGAVLKGTGRARGLRLEQGQVIQAFGLFDSADVKMQSFFHSGRARDC
jgi:NDP-sugar pyrophosphorylase family protein